MTHTPKWIIETAVKCGDWSEEDVIKHFLLDGYGLKTAKKYLREYEDLGLIWWEGSILRTKWPISKSTIAVPSLSS